MRLRKLLQRRALPLAALLLAVPLGNVQAEDGQRYVYACLEDGNVICTPGCQSGWPDHWCC